LILCIPTDGQKGLEENVAAHFGRAKTYTIFDSSTNQVRVITNNGQHNGGNGTASEHLLGENIEAVLAANLGPKALEELRKKGILVYMGAQGTVSDAIYSWSNGRLQRATRESVCKDNQH
jgi:predicted Fe-Mo cluster-binding NifX family protein